jgi:site-specific recombinase XerD
MDLFDSFLQERKYLKGVSPATLRYYRWVRRAFSPILAEPTKEGMLKGIQKLLADGVSPTSVNTYLRGFKAYVRWLHQEGHLLELFRVEFLRTETKILTTFSADQVRKLILYRPTFKNDKRSQAIALLILDTGLRIGEALGLRKDAVDFDNMLLQVRGKGNRVRKVPFSLECRKVLFKTCSQHRYDLVFCTRDGNAMSQTNFLRDFKTLAAKLGITGVRVSPHTLRHSFAVNFLTSGGDIYLLSRILGHTSVKTTEVYLRSLGVGALQEAQARTTLLRVGRGR